MPAVLLATASSSTLAAVTTLHAALLVLRQQRTVKTLGAATVLLPALGFTASPWFVPMPLLLAAGVLAHLAWFVACEKLVPAPTALRRAPVAALQTAAAAAPVAMPARPVEVAHEPRSQGSAFERVPVLAVFHETEEIKTFRMLRPDGFEFTAGQFLTVRVQVDGKPLVRCYSISSAPAAAGYLEISVKRQGIVSGMLHSTVRPGSMLAVKRPAGKFTYPEGDDRPLVFLAGGVGITPLMSMFRHATAHEPTRPATLILSVRDEKCIPFHRELDLLAERHPQAKVAIVVSGGPFSLGHFTGVINAEIIRKLVPDVAGSIFMICGPGPMMEAMKELLSSLGVPQGQIRYEVFEAAVAISKEETVPGHKPARTPPAPLRMPGRSPEGKQLTLRRSGLTVAVAPNQTLLEAAEASGAAMDSSCRAGVCLTCRARLLSGEVDCSSDSLDDADRAAGHILPCVSYPKGNCVLDA